MKVLVTGGAGYIGSQMVYSLLDAGYDVSIIDNLSTGYQSNVPDNIEFLEYNIGAGEKVTNFLRQNKFDAVFHFAASIKVEESEKNPLKYYQNNFCETQSFLASCIAADVDKFIFSSTAAVYGDKSKNLSSETDPLKPNNTYGLTKSYICWNLSCKIFNKTYEKNRQ